MRPVILRLHFYAGVLVAPFILIATITGSATGITWSLYAGETVSDIRAEFGWQRPALDTALATNGAAGPVDLDGVVAAANTAGVQAPLEISLPAEPGQAVGVAEIDTAYRLTTDSVAVDPANLSVTNVVDYHRDHSLVAKLADWGIRGHMGFLFGWLNQLLLLLVAVGLTTVIVRGYRMWWQRRPTRGSQWAVGRPPMRGGLRRQHPAALAALTLTVVAVGLFLPLLGASLVVFLALDAAIALVKARRAPSSKA